MNQVLLYIIIFCILPVMVLIGAWTACIGAAHADNAMLRNHLTRMERKEGDE